MKRFGEKLKILRLEKKLTLQEIAQLFGYKAHGYISELESGKKQPSVEFVIQVSRFFNVTTDELLIDEDDLVNRSKK